MFSLDTQEGGKKMKGEEGNKNKRTHGERWRKVEISEVCVNYHMIYKWYAKKLGRQAARSHNERLLQR